jgi:sec-independent protein translocase protein TatA
MFGEHLPDLIVIMAVALLIFGPKKLPEMGNAIGKSIRAFRKGVAEGERDSDKETGSKAD